MNLENREQLQEFVNSGNKVKYLFFWGHQKPKSGVSQSCFSQWYGSSFEKNGVTYLTAEHFMMAKKADLFGDTEVLEKVLNAKNPGEAKKVGRTVKGFNEEKWLQHRFDIVVEANMLKFSQNPELKEYLLNTGNRVLVEASQVDKIWGIGLASDDSKAQNPNQWKGLNLLGFALMKVRNNQKHNL